MPMSALPKGVKVLKTVLAKAVAAIAAGSGISQHRTAVAAVGIDVRIDFQQRNQTLHVIIMLGGLQMCGSIFGNTWASRK